MSINLPSQALRRARHVASYTQLCSSLRLLQLSNPRNFSSTSQRSALFSSKKTSVVDLEDENKRAIERANAAVTKAQKLAEEEEQRAPQLGRLAETSIFGDVDHSSSPARRHEQGVESTETGSELDDFDNTRNITAMERVLNPRPRARERWQRKMVIRHIKRGGRLTKEMAIARTERKHQTQSHFFKTSIKKLMPLARQIAGKPLDQAILQMRFSNKKVAQDVKAHLITARNEAIVGKGMGGHLGADAIVLDPSIRELTPDEKPMKTPRTKKPAETDIYIAEAWVNRGKFEKQPEFRARGRVNILRKPFTGITVVLKEEKTRNRIQTEKEVKAIRKRIGSQLWTQLPDRPVTKQSQYLLW